MAELIKELFECVKRRLCVERVEDGLHQDQIRPTVYETFGGELIVVDKHLIGHVSIIWFVYTW